MSCYKCGPRGCIGGRIDTYDEWGRVTIDCDCDCHGVYCPICEKMHKPGQKCKVRHSRVAQERAAERDNRSRH